MQKAFLSLICVATCAAPTLSQSPTTINACVNNLNGATRVVLSSTNCINGLETFKQWNVTGPAGPAGANGLQGPLGPRGATGPQGPEGQTGVTDRIGPQGPAGSQGPAGPQGSAGPQGATGTIGPVAPYVADATYNVGQVVYCQVSGACNTAGQGSSFVSLINNNTGKDPFLTNSRDWQQITSAGAAGTPGVAGPTGPAGSNAPPTSVVAKVSNNAFSGHGTLGVSQTGPNTEELDINFPVQSPAMSSIDAFYSSGDLIFRNTNPYSGANGSNTCTVGDTLLSVVHYTAGAYLPADGRLLSIQTYPAPFSLFGVNFGGNGSSNFALPNLTAIAPPGMYYSICVSGNYPNFLP